MSKPTSNLDHIERLVKLGKKCEKAGRDDLADEFFDRVERILDNAETERS